MSTKGFPLPIAVNNNTCAGRDVERRSQIAIPGAVSPVGGTRGGQGALELLIKPCLYFSLCEKLVLRGNGVVNGTGNPLERQSPQSTVWFKMGRQNIDFKTWVLILNSYWRTEK